MALLRVSNKTARMSSIATSLLSTLCSSDFLFFASIALFLGSLLVPDKKQNLSRHIEFKEARTIDEAKAYAKNNLGVKMNIKDLEYANLCNEAFTNVSNVFGGNVHFPKKIKTGHIFMPNALGMYKQTAFSSSITIDKNKIEKRISDLDEFLRYYTYEDLTSTNYGEGYEDFCELLKKAYKAKYSLTTFEKLALATSIGNIQQILYQGARCDSYGRNDYGNVYVDKFALVYHELGHCFDLKSSSDIKAFFKVLRNGGAELKNKILPEYSKSKPSEFVAEIFAGLVQGKTFDNNIMNLFRKYTNMELPKSSCFYV